MKKEDYLNKIHDITGYKKVEIEEIITSYLSLLEEDILNNEKVSITNLGTFQKKLITPSVMFSPIDGSTLKTKKYYRLTFSCGKNLSEKLKESIK